MLVRRLQSIILPQLARAFSPCLRCAIAAVGGAFAGGEVVVEDGAAERFDVTDVV
jgi:hypothetical protein